MAAPRPRQGPGVPLLRMDERFIEALAAALAECVVDRLGADADDAEAGYLNAEAAGRYICASRKRVHELTSANVLVPDGYDGRTPLFLRRTLDEYVRREGGRP